MILAKEAKSKSDDVRRNLTANELQNIDGAVNKAIAKGKRDCYFYNYISKDTIIELQNLGYNVVRCTTQMSGEEYHINW